MNAKLPTKRFVKSKYLLNFELDGKRVLCSGITTAIFLVDSDVEELLNYFREPKYIDEACRGYSKCGETVKKLINGGMIVEENVDELEILNSLITKVRNEVPYSFVFTVTLACNFRCIYCYEEKHPVEMTWDVASRCINFMVERIKESKQKDVRIIFYGGEPLLKFNLIKKILIESEKRLPNCIKISTGIVTNGSLLTEKVARFMKRFNCNYSLISLDGLRETHNRRRPFASGEGSFDAVVKGIKNAIKNFSQVIIRINVDKTNKKELPAFLEWLKYNNMIKPNVIVDFGVVTADTEVSERHSQLCISSYDYGRKLVELIQLARSKGISSFFIPPTLLYCRTYFKREVAFGPTGDLLSCLHRIEKRFTVGNVFNSPVYNKNAKKFYERTPLNFEKCRNCNIVGFCGGGCVSEAYHENGNVNTVVCPMFKYNFDELVKQYIIRMEDTYGV